MRSYVEFRSQALLDADFDDGDPHGEAVARLLATRLPEHGHDVQDVVPEDWGWRVEVRNPAFPLWIGCGHYQQYADGHLCFIEPSRPHVRRWLRRVPTRDVVEHLATAIEQVLLADPQVRSVRWWTEAEVQLGRG